MKFVFEYNKINYSSNYCYSIVYLHRKKINNLLFLGERVFNVWYKYNQNDLFPVERLPTIILMYN